MDLLGNVRAAIHETAERLRALPDVDLVQLAMAADAMGGGKPVPTAAIRAERRKVARPARKPRVAAELDGATPKPRKAKVDKAPANPSKPAGMPKGALTATGNAHKNALAALLQKSPRTTSQLSKSTGLTVPNACRYLNMLVSEGAAVRPEKKGGVWSLA